MLGTFSRKVVGWSIDSAQTATLVTNALWMAISNRQPSGTVIHSDHGCADRTTQPPPVEERRHSSLGMLTPVKYERLHPIVLSAA